MALKVCFVMTYCERDASLTAASAAALKSLYPDATVLVIDDSTTRLKLAPNGGQWSQRWMSQALASGADIIVKLDPDTRAVKVASFPAEDVFGMQAPEGTYFPQSSGVISGGAIGFQAAAVQKILDSGFLLDAKYTEKPYATEERRFGHPRPTVILQDPIVGDVAQRLGLSQGVWEGLDIHFSWEPPVPFRKDATFVHPVK